MRRSPKKATENHCSLVQNTVAHSEQMDRFLNPFFFLAQVLTDLLAPTNTTWTNSIGFNMPDEGDPNRFQLLARLVCHTYNHPTKEAPVLGNF